MAAESSATHVRSRISRTAKLNALTKLSFLTDDSKTGEPSDEEILNFFGCYSDSQVNKLLKEMRKDAHRYKVRPTLYTMRNEGESFNVGRNHPWGKRLRQLKGFKFTHDIRLAPSKIHGFGLFSHSQIAKDEIIMEYTGEKITKQESEERAVTYLKQGIQESYFAALDENYVIDGTYSANMSKYINHSCDPNSILEVIQVEGVKKIVVTSKRKIKPTEELTYDYMFEDEKKRLACLCKSSRCRGFVNLIARP